jgi:hypothetical protein
MDLRLMVKPDDASHEKQGQRKRGMYIDAAPTVAGSPVLRVPARWRCGKAVNNLGEFDGWDFLVCRDLDRLLPSLAGFVDGKFGPGNQAMPADSVRGPRGPCSHDPMAGTVPAAQPAGGPIHGRA